MRLSKKYFRSLLRSRKKQFILRWNDGTQVPGRRLSEKLCEAWQWRQANGALRDMVCRGLLLMLDRTGQIELPTVKFVPHNPFVRRARPEPMPVDTTPILGPLAKLRPVEIEQVRRTDHERLFNSLMEQYHYLAYEQPVGEHLKFLVWAQGRPVACLAWSSAPRHLGSRDRYSLSDFALGSRSPSGFAHSRPDDEPTLTGVGTAVRPPGVLCRNVHRPDPLSRHLLPCRQLEVSGTDHGTRQKRSHV